MGLLRVDGALLWGSNEPYLISKELYLLSKEPYLYVYSIDKYINIHIMYMYVPPKKLLGGGISTPYTLFCLICTINSELTYFPMCTTIEWAGVDIRWFPVDGFDTRWIPKSFLCGYEHMYLFYTCIYSRFCGDVCRVNIHRMDWIHLYNTYIYVVCFHLHWIWLLHLFYTCKCSRFRVDVCRVNIYRIDCIHLYNTYIYVVCIHLHWIWYLHLFYACKSISSRLM